MSPPAARNLVFAQSLRHASSRGAFCTWLLLIGLAEPHSLPDWKLRLGERRPSRRRVWLSIRRGGELGKLEFPAELTALSLPLLVLIPRAPKYPPWRNLGNDPIPISIPRTHLTPALIPPLPAAGGEFWVIDFSGSPRELWVTNHFHHVPPPPPQLWVTGHSYFSLENPGNIAEDSGKLTSLVLTSQLPTPHP